MILILKWASSSTRRRKTLAQKTATTRRNPTTELKFFFRKIFWQIVFEGETLKEYGGYTDIEKDQAGRTACAMYKVVGVQFVCFWTILEIVDKGKRWNINFDFYWKSGIDWNMGEPSCIGLSNFFESVEQFFRLVRAIKQFEILERTFGAETQKNETKKRTKNWNDGNAGFMEGVSRKLDQKNNSNRKKNLVKIKKVISIKSN